MTLTAQTRQPVIGGLIPFSSVDYPGQLACVVFLAGCPWRCSYCHNPHLLSRKPHAGAPAWSDTLAWLQTRRHLLDAVVFSGGEPLSEPLLPRMLADVKALGMKTALHTGGAWPERLARCLPLLDWVGLDIKAPFADYAQITTKLKSGAQARTSLQHLLASGVAYECRTTLHPALLDTAQLRRLAATLAVQGVQHYVLQPYRAAGCDQALPIAQGWPDAALLNEMGALFAHFSVRGIT